MDVISYALSKKIAEHAVSGVQSMSVEGQNLIINTKDSGVLTMTFPTPKDGVSVTDIDVNANNQIVFTMSDGTEFISGKIPTVKGDAGFSPIITENADNTDKIYKLDITTADSTFTTPNLKGGAGGSGEENKINSISVNGVNIVPDENKNVDIAVPTVTNDLTDELKSSYDDAVTAKHAHDNKTVLDDITAEKVESWNKAEENVQSDWNETDDTADGFIKNKPTIPDAYDDTALSRRVDDVETSIGDMSTIEVKSVPDLVSAINVLYNAFMSSINYANKKLTITYRNGGTVDIDMSAIITDTNIGELSNVDDTGITDKQVLSYDTATNKYIPTTIDTAGVLADAKKYTDDEIAKINNADAISVDEKPTYSNGTITYKKDGVEKTITDGDFWFFYTVDNMAYQTIWIDGVEFTTSVDGSVDFKDFVSKTNDLTSTYTGEETDKTKVTTIASLDALYAIISTALGKKINTADIVDSLVSDATDKPLSAAQGKALDTKISNFVTTVEEDYAKTADIPTTLPANGGNADTVNNHTVESDVPTDAVFTDTIYDDTEVKESIEELSSNLDTLSYDENAGGKNLLDLPNPYYITGSYATDITIKVKKNTNYTLSVGSVTSSVFQGIIVRPINSDTNIIAKYSAPYIMPFNSGDNETIIIFFYSGNATSGTSVYSDVQLEEGTQQTTYEPYIPSVKMLAEEVSAQNESLAYNASKNMLFANVGTISGVTITSKDKSTALLNGTSTANVSVFTTADVIPSGSYHLKLSNKVGSMFVWDTTHSKTIIDVDNTECNFTLTEPSKLLVGFSVGSGHSFTNFEVSGQLEKGTVATDFVPYNGKSNLELTNDVVSLKNDLDTLEFGEVAGTKNLFEDEIKWMENITVTRGTKSVSDGKITLTATSNDCYTDHDGSSWKNNGIKTIPCKPNTKYTFSWEYEGDSVGDIYIFENGSSNNMVYTFNTEHKLSITTSADAEYLIVRVGVRNLGTSITYWNFQLEKGDTATPYEPYIPSVKMLASENAQQNTEAMDLKMLGWTVPKECPIQNYVDSDGVFHQRVGRVDLGSLEWDNSSAGFFYSSDVENMPILITGGKSGYCSVYGSFYSVSYQMITTKDKTITYSNSSVAVEKIVCIRDTSYTDTTTFKTAMQGVYLYYELAEEKTINVDGNEAVTKVNESLSVIGKCKNLLNPTLQTTTMNDVTCTNNGDGTYTLNGTASGLTTFILCDMKLDSSLSYKLTGCPLGGDWDNGYSMYVEKQYWGIDVGKGYEITLTDASNICGVYIRIIEGTVCNNLTFKPMITTDLSATYDDYVPYTGDGDTLTADVAELKNDLMFKNVWSGEIYKANETATISNFSNSKKYLFEFKAKSNAYKQNVIVLGNQAYIEVPLIGHASTIAFTLYRLNISSNGVVTISDVINEDSGASLVNIYEI